ncbi:hypothetical protein OUZ56_029373 [Daphnia magna]|uniref:Uncharacterized protein n=1 Tax=Daphnia magna TaxID=35525 RepID=A0ABR0B6N2_9CRUS|nr:hypothetical protein OUZ56_029373 [Daphnia magna]
MTVIEGSLWGSKRTLDIVDRRGSNGIVAKDPEEGHSTTEEDHRDIEDRRGATRSSRSPWDHRDIEDRSLAP